MSATLQHSNIYRSRHRSCEITAEQNVEIRRDICRNLSPILGIKATQVFLTAGQAF